MSALEFRGVDVIYPRRDGRAGHESVRRTLARLAGGMGSAADDDLPDEALRTELAARWLSVEQLDSVRR